MRSSSQAIWQCYCYLVSPLRPCFALLLFPTLALSQWVSAGVTGGVPISPQSQQSSPGFLLNGVSGPNDLLLKPYVVGGTVQVNLMRSWNLSAVAEFQYERMHQDVTYSNVKGTGPLNFGTRGAASANVWMFPLLLRYGFGHRRLSPFVDLGATLRHLGTFNGSGTQLDFFLQPQPLSLQTAPGGNPEIAITAGAGIRVPVYLFDATAEVRYLHWTASYFMPVQNQAMLTVSVTFPARHK
jgi:hypothetical protein